MKIEISNTLTDFYRNFILFFIILNFSGILFTEFFNIEVDQSIAITIIISFFIIHIFFTSRLKKVYIDFDDEKIIYKKEEITFDKIYSINRYWLCFYKINFIQRSKKMNILYLIRFIDFFRKPDYIKKIKDKKFSQ